MPSVLPQAAPMQDLFAFREQYLKTGQIPSGVRPIVRDSWERCRGYGIEPHRAPRQHLDPVRLTHARQANRLLMECAEPFLQTIHETLSDEPHLVALCDADGYVLRIVADPACEAAAAATNLFEGASWNERDIGCNGVGTCLATGQPVILLGPEHFVEADIGWTCIGIPLNAEDGSVVGVLDLSVPNEHVHPHTWGWMLSIAQNIVNRLATSSPCIDAEAEAALGDLRDPINSIRGVLDLLASQLGLSPTHGQFIDQAREAVDAAAEKLRRSVDQLLAAQKRLKVADRQKDELLAERQRIEQALRASEESFRAMAEGIPHMVWETDGKGINHYQNRVWYDYIGAGPGSSFGTDWLNYYHPDDRAHLIAEWTKALSSNGEHIYDTEARIRRHDGVYRWFRVKGAPIRSRDGVIAKWVGTCTDIDDQKRTTEALRESESLHRVIASNIPDGLVCVVDRDLRYRLVDGPLLASFGQVREQVEGHRPSEVLDAELSQMIERRMWRALSGETTEYETERGGRVFWSQYLPLRDANGHVTAAMSLMLDITRRKRAEQITARQAAELNTLYATAPVGLFFFDADLRFVRVNQMMAELNGLPEEQHIGRTLRELLTAELADEVEPLLRQVIDNGQPILDREVHGATAPRPHELRDWLVSYYPVRSEDGTIRGVHGTVQEITQRKAVESALTAAKRSADVAKAAAEEANHAKDHFLAILSHELRTPLTPVLAGVAMLQADSRLDHDTQELLATMRRNAELEAQLIDDLLDTTRIARGKVELKRQPIQLCEVLRRAVSICRPDIEARGLRFGVDMGSDAPYLLEADLMRLQQVFWNLLRNAIKFTPRGGCIDVRCRLDGLGHVVAEVRDSGMGIDAESLQRIFNAFEQGERSVTRQFGGLGLRLAICKALVEMHGGAIEAHSDGRNQGATFLIRLPIVSAGKGKVTIQSDGSPADTAAPPAVPAPRHILLVEDHGDTARLMKRLLEAEGHSVQTAGDVATALELASSQDFDLLISDLGLPDGSGLDLMRALRSRGNLLPGIALSGYGQVEDIRRSREAGFVEHLTKPTGPDRLIAAIAAVAHKGT